MTDSENILFKTLAAKYLWWMMVLVMGCEEASKGVSKNDVPPKEAITDAVAKDFVFRGIKFGVRSFILGHHFEPLRTRSTNTGCLTKIIP